MLSNLYQEIQEAIRHWFESTWFPGGPALIPIEVRPGKSRHRWSHIQHKSRIGKHGEKPAGVVAEMLGSDVFNVSEEVHRYQGWFIGHALSEA